MANKPMGFLNIGSDNYEIVDKTGRQSTQELALTVSQLSASNLPYNSNLSIKGKIDENPNGLNGNIARIKSSSISTSTPTQINTNDISKYKLLRFFTSYYSTTQRGPDYGGEVISVEQFRLYTSEYMRVSRWDGAYSFAVRYVSDTKIEVYFPNGTQSDNACLIVVGIL